jgi:hypothetical protein
MGYEVNVKPLWLPGATLDTNLVRKHRMEQRAATTLESARGGRRGYREQTARWDSASSRQYLGRR